ncbi:MAG: hypothetical protein EOO88_43705 [Pedobacter sp.]|nr:MAG: hypothetical protein EOO88_43705 [Pedobacter sp.]
MTVNQETKEIVILPGIELNAFYTTLGLKGGDIVTEVDGKPYNLDNIYDLVMGSQNWKENGDITVKIKRDGKEQVLKGKIKLPYVEETGYIATDNTKQKLREAWLKG